MDDDDARKLQTLEEVCRERELPLTQQRKLVLKALLERKDHPTADELYHSLCKRQPQIARRTIYRVLDTFVEWGLIRRVHHAGAAVRFDAKTTRHHHLVCTYCNKIVDLENRDLDSIPLPKKQLHGFTVNDFSVQLMGICSECRKAKE